ncbi:MAG: methylenetetrahydrofolate reductase [Thermodesulfobacteriota bacterium]|jgi:5,10-methylenetetrahydrofolate reductase
MYICEIIKRRKFVVTCEIDSPKGINIEEFLDKADMVKDYVDAIHIGDNQRAVMRAAPLAICHVLKEKQIETIMELSAQYRNRLALQADLLGAAILGVENILLTKGFDPSIGDHAEAKPVLDLDCVALVKTAVTLTKGVDMTGHALNEAPNFCLGVTAVPELETDGAHLAELKEKISLGASYIQTQPIYEPEVLEKFLESISGLNVPVIVGHMMLKSASMARFINSNLPGVTVPERLIRELEGLSRDQLLRKSLQVSIELLRKMKPLCQGVHLIPAGWERYISGIIPQIVGERTPKS